MKKLIPTLFLTTIIFGLFVLRLSAGIGAGESPTGALPVELISFTAKVIGHTVELNWRTATEVKNYGFEVERATTKSEQGWSRIGFVEGHGNSNSPKEYSFTDVPQIETKFQYRLKQIDTDGKYGYSSVVSIEIKAPTQFTLNQNYPNPFNPATIISYSIPISSNVKLQVYDVLGNLVVTLVDESQEVGSYAVTFNANALSNGIYYYKIQSGSYVSVKKMLLLK
jgi:hypothetical protein